MPGGLPASGAGLAAPALVQDTELSHVSWQGWAGLGRAGAHPLGWAVLGTLGAWPPVSWAWGSQLRLPSGPSSLPGESMS